MSKKELMERLKQAEADRNENADDANYWRQQSDDYKEKYEKQQQSSAKDKNELFDYRSKYRAEKYTSEKLSKENSRLKDKNESLNDTVSEIKSCLILSNKISMFITEIMKNIATSAAACNKLYEALDKNSMEDFDFVSNSYKKEISNLEYPIPDRTIEILERNCQSYFDYGARYASYTLKMSAYQCLGAAEDLLEKLNSIVKLLDSFKNNGVNYGKDLEKMHNFYARVVQSQISKVNLVIPIMQKISSVKNMIWVD